MQYCAVVRLPKQIQDKLGADWKLVVGWPTFQKLTGETATKEWAKSKRQWVPNHVYQDYVSAITAEAKWESSPLLSCHTSRSVRLAEQCRARFPQHAALDLPGRAVL